jgi:hypothetical protein
MPTGISKRSRARVIGYEDLRPDIVGLDVMNRGKLRLDQWATPLPLAALSQDILDYIDAHGGTGGGEVADAVVYFGTNPNSIAGAGNSNVISPTVTAFKLRGFYVYGDGDATITLTFTPSGSTAKTLKWKIHNIERNGLWTFANPIVLTNSTAVTLNIHNDTAGAVDYYSMLTGEAVI